jgi:hypothetical protein
MLSALTLVLAFWQGSGPAILAGPFVGAAIGAVPQALLLRRSAAPGQWSGRALAWITTSTLGGLLEIGFYFVALRYDGASPPLLADVIHWVAPVTAVVSLVVAGAQTAALYRLVPIRGLLAYLPLTMAGWIVGWSISTLNGDAALGGSLLARIDIYLWAVAPYVLIGAFSGVVLAPALSTRNQERLAGAYPWIVSAVAALLDLVVVIAVIVFVH